MRGRLYLSFTALTLAMLLPGCVQATRHSNTMLFGTNTKFGLSVGTTPANIPEINVGYSRQEAVVLPLVANVADNGTVQTPCDMSSGGVGAEKSKFAVHPCSLVAVKAEALDSYSVLASFGADFDGSANADGSKAKGGLAQYFATGMAAQLLAFNGGASVVAVGEAAIKAAEQEPPDASAVKALFGGESAFVQGTAMRTSYRDFRERLLAKVRLTKADHINAEMRRFETKVGFAGSGIADDCMTVDGCLAAIKDVDPYMRNYMRQKQQFEDALDLCTYQ